ncbi:MAG: redoxin domain-containing protein [Vicingaceae bacterium]|nr:redoxin domain-containing protein [Vicingaceae bacterium]
MRILFFILQFLTAGVFILSGISKLFPIEPFEVVFIDLGISNWILAPFIARTIIAFEIFIGVSILINLWANKLIYYLAQSMLVVFSLYLIFLLFTEGNTSDCGCFGQLIALSPLSSLMKNIVLMLVLFALPKKDWLPKIWLFVIGLLITSFITTFLLNRVGLQNTPSKSLNKVVDWSGLPQTFYQSNTAINFTSGKKILVFFSASCPHCENAAHKLSFLNKENNITNVFIVIASKKEDNLKEFITSTALNYPILWMTDDTFFKYSGGTLPSIYYVEESIVKKKWTGEFFDVEELKEFITYN